MRTDAKEAVEDLLPRGTFHGVAQIIRRAWIRAAASSLALVGDQVGGAPMVNLDDPLDPLRQVIDREAARRIVAIETETRRRVAAYVAQGAQEGLSPAGLAKLIEADASGAFGRARALVIARTESGTAYNLASLEGYRASGRVAKVKIFDGDGCGWTHHNDPDVANGSVRSLDEAQAQPLSHPNCVRAWTPVVGEDAP